MGAVAWRREGLGKGVSAERARCAGVWKTASMTFNDPLDKIYSGKLAINMLSIIAERKELSRYDCSI